MVTILPKRTGETREEQRLFQIDAFHSIKHSFVDSYYLELFVREICRECLACNNKNKLKLESTKQYLV